MHARGRRTRRIESVSRGTVTLTSWIRQSAKNWTPQQREERLGLMQMAAAALARFAEKINDGEYAYEAVAEPFLDAAGRAIARAVLGEPRPAK